MSTVNDFTSLYRRTVKDVGVGGSVVRIYLPRVHEGVLRVLSHVSVEDKTSACTRCRLGIDTGLVEHFFCETLAPAAGQLVVSRGKILVGEGERLFGELIGTFEGDELLLTGIGWELNLA